MTSEYKQMALEKLEDELWEKERELMEATKFTEQYLCQSYVDDDGLLQDCTCGKCQKSLTQKEAE